MKHRRFRAGDPVLVRSPEEILATLDAEGTLGGLPFMPEMVDWCAKPFTIQRRAEKTCVDSHPMRRFFANDVVILDGPRCDGGAHDGCQRGCRIFWKEAWLRPCDAATTEPEASETAFQALRARLKVKSDEHRYLCQSTQLLTATVAFSGKATLWMPWVAFNEVLGRDLSVARIVKLFTRWSWQKLRRAATGKRLRGSGKRTPAGPLHLNPGEVVRVKSPAEIVATLDRIGRNRGMFICDEMLRCCGHEAEVRYRVDRIIDEHSGVMRKLSETVVLHNARQHPALYEECLCYGEPGDCPRGELMYWREIWLERVNGPKSEDQRS